jgi:hypothetical protein
LTKKGLFGLLGVNEGVVVVSAEGVGDGDDNEDPFVAVAVVDSAE